MTVEEFRPALAVSFIEWLRTRSSSRKAQQLDLALTAGNGHLLAADYQGVLQAGAALADTLRRGELDRTTLDWLQTNFYKTGLELGHCLRLPQEGPCEWDIYLTCPKFVATPQYVPRLQERLRTEERLIADATERGWAREIERHRCAADRIRRLLDELNTTTPANSGNETAANAE
ncbi:hypothetical protein Q0Z83_053110 [Actinoplanes sichuanensis]|uniref:Uncharacterized protein n=1 Tax=Actinoplanes sichuanensis TaxID=512349 RepID=A0ABW4AU03_9ACTN|nr:hypothetical protein [Actinoplanes sichuanensis]BEL07120.1 hypothetical protein Q0Z83_053110 [Actinoplanes sichuanensis]